MTRNPFINAMAATFYISVVASVMFYGTKNMANTPDTSFIGPLALLSLFTLSAAVMGYIFGYQPLTLFLDGKKKEAVNLFLETVAVFGVVTALLLGLLFSGLLN